MHGREPKGKQTMRKRWMPNHEPINSTFLTPSVEHQAWTAGSWMTWAKNGGPVLCSFSRCFFFFRVFTFVFTSFHRIFLFSLMNHELPGTYPPFFHWNKSPLFADLLFVAFSRKVSRANSGIRQEYIFVFSLPLDNYLSSILSSIMHLSSHEYNVFSWLFVFSTSDLESALHGCHIPRYGEWF